MLAVITCGETNNSSSETRTAGTNRCAALVQAGEHWSTTALISGKTAPLEHCSQVQVVNCIKEVTYYTSHPSFAAFTAFSATPDRNTLLVRPPVQRYLAADQRFRLLEGGVRWPALLMYQTLQCNSPRQANTIQKEQLSSCILVFDAPRRLS